MKSIKGCVDHLQVVEGQQIEIKGWAANVSDKNPETDIEIYMDGSVTECVCHWHERADLPAEYGGKPGFLALFTCPVPRELKIYAVSCNDRVILRTYHKNELADYFFSASASYHIDSVQYLFHQKQIQITGWMIQHHKSEPIEFAIIDSQSRQISCHVERRIRSDVNTAYGEDAFHESGFILTFPASDTGMVQFCFLIHGSCKVAEVIHIAKLQKEQSKRHRLLQMLGISRWSGHIQSYRKYNIQKLAKEYALIMDDCNAGYSIWRKRQLPDKGILDCQRNALFSYAPLISIIVPLYETQECFFVDMVKSCIAQSYQNWELCLADGSALPNLKTIIEKHFPDEVRIRYQHLERNEGISGNTNKALEMSAGDCIMFCDHDDFLAPNALYELVKEWNSPESPDLIYTDEDKVNTDGNVFFDPTLKPNFNFELLLGHNYINHIFAVKRHIISRAGVLRAEFDGAQDFDFVLRCCEASKSVSHIPQILYHWRCHQESTSENPGSKLYAFENGKKVIEEYYHRNHIPAAVEMTRYAGIYRTRHFPVGNPLISIIISGLKEDAVIEQLISLTNYTNIDFYFCDISFRMPEALQQAALQAKGEYLVFLPPNARPQDKDWLTELLSYAQREDVGVVGGKNLNQQMCIESAGIILGIGHQHIAGKAFHGFPESSYTYMGKVNFTQEVSAVTAQTMMVKKDFFEKLGGFDCRMSGDLAAIDFCLRTWTENKKVILNPYACVMLGFSGSDDFEITGSKDEKACFLEKWGAVLAKTDWYYNPNLSEYTCDSDLKWTK